MWKKPKTYAQLHGIFIKEKKPVKLWDPAKKGDFLSSLGMTSMHLSPWG